ncbi:MAG: Polysacc synt C protein [Candidatus Magasanikbacteria bacterium]|nr:Polysacc synt C protein [Candidatus Magasanikbacteria bacterium]
MSLVRAVAKNTGIQILGKGISTLLGIIIVGIFARYLGAAGFGIYTTVITFLTFFGIIVDFGLTLTTVQMISEPAADEQKIVSNLFTLRTVSAVIFLALAPIIAFFTPYSPEIKFGIIIATASFFFIALNQVLTGIFQKHLAMTRVMIAENVGRLILLIFSVLIVKTGGGLSLLLAAIVLGAIGNFLTLWFSARPLVKIKLEIDWPIWRKIFSRSWPMAVSIIFNLIYLRADTLIMSLTRSATEVGLYGAAYRVIDIALMIPVMMMGIIVPLLTAAWAANQHDIFRSRVARTFDAFIIIILPIVAGGVLLAEPIMALVGGPEFFAADTALRILLIALFGAFISTLFGHTIVALKLQRAVIWIYGLDAAISLTAYLLLIPRFGIPAGAWVTVFSEWFAAIILGAIVWRASHLHLRFGVAFKSLGAVILMSAILFFARAWPVWILIPLGAAIYAALIIGFRAVPKETLRQIFQTPLASDRLPD